MPSRTSASYIAAYDRTFLHWSRYGQAPSFVRFDAETSTDLKTFLRDDKKVTFQYFPTGTHRANRAERTWKIHFISTLATAFPTFPMSYWNKLIPLAELTLNCLLPWQPNPCHLRLSWSHRCSVRLPRAPDCPRRYLHTHP
jgi:hypothetical protein